MMGPRTQSDNAARFGPDVEWDITKFLAISTLERSKNTKNGNTSQSASELINSSQKNMTSDQFIEHIENFYAKNVALTRKKNADYAGTGDVFRSFKVTEMLNNTTVEEGMIVRLGDKLSRIATLIKQDAQVKDESIQDTLADIANYAAIFSAYLESKK